MPTVTIDGAEVRYELDGPEGAPCITFANSLGTTLELWDGQLATLRGRYRCLRFDARGHGGSGFKDGAFSIDDLATDLRALLDALAIERTHLVGVSLGGMVAQAFATRFPNRLVSLVLLATTAFMPPREEWLRRADLARREGMASLANAVMGRWFTSAFVGDPRAAAVRDRFLRIAPEGYAVCCGAIAEMDLRARLAAIEAPTLIVAGADDPATPVAMMEQLRQGIRGAEMLIIPRAAHLFLVERADALAPYLATFLDRHRRDLPPGPSGFAEGLANRTLVLGAEHVGRSLEAAGSFGAPWQDFLTRYAWGEVWGDPALPWKTRSMMTLAMMAALHREEEFKLHLRAARGNGVTLDELRAILMQCAVYAGIPAANAAFRWVKESLGEEVSRGAGSTQARASL